MFGGGCLERDLDHRGKKGKQDTEGIFSAMELQWPGTTLLRIEYAHVLRCVVSLAQKKLCLRCNPALRAPFTSGMEDEYVPAG